MSPERVCTSRFTGPLTSNFLSNVPCGVDARAKVQAESMISAIAEDRAGRQEEENLELGWLFIS
jgi:hypothetical protein